MPTGFVWCGLHPRVSGLTEENEMLEEKIFLSFGNRRRCIRVREVGVLGAAPHLEHKTDGKADLNAHPEGEPFKGRLKKFTQISTDGYTHLACVIHDSFNL